MAIKVKTVAKLIERVDNIYSVGLHASDKNIIDPRNWKVENLLGFALMEARDQLK